MVSAREAVQRYVAAVVDPGPARLAELEGCLADDVEVVGLVGGAKGKASVVEAIAAPNATRLVSAAEWSDVTEEGGQLIVEARLPEGGQLGAIRFAFTLVEDGRIARVGQQIVPAAPPEPQPLAITTEQKELIAGALMNGTPVIVAYVDGDGVPHVSPRGSVQVLNGQQMAMWAREPEGGLLKGIARNPNIALYYRDPKTRASLTIAGRAHAVTDSETRDTVYENQAAVERSIDGRKLGVAVVIDVDSFEAAGPAGRMKMLRTVPG